MIEEAIVKCLPFPYLKLGEGPHWIEKEKCLLVVDVFDKAIRKYYDGKDEHGVLYLDVPEAHRASMAIPIDIPQDEKEWGRLVVGLGKMVGIARWCSPYMVYGTNTPCKIYTIQDPHMNDAKCDAKGRLWFGTMTYLNDKEVPAGKEDSGLYCCDSDLKVTKWLDKTTISNGMAWSPDNKFFYFIDSGAGTIYEFDYNLEEGSIANKSVLLDFEEEGLTDQSPDGMTIDSNGNLWVACFGGAQVICVDTERRCVIRKIHIPSPHVTSCCFGGEGLSTLFVTTGTMRLTEEQKRAYPEAGGTFAVTGLGVRGMLPVNFKCNLDKFDEVFSSLS